ncbi:MAG: P1 family peptidase [Ktedonobacteraceae bacterium]
MHGREMWESSLEQQAQQPHPGRAAPLEKREQRSIIVLLATNSPVDARPLGRLTRRIPLDLSRTGTHGCHGSGA